MRLTLRDNYRGRLSVLAAPRVQLSGRFAAVPANPFLSDAYQIARSAG
jgi:hypothetical protein